MGIREQLNDDEETTERERNQRVDEGPVETDATNRRRAHATEEDKLPLVVQRRVTHQRVEFGGSILDRQIIMNNLYSLA